MSVGLVSIPQRISNFIKRCAFNPFKNPNPVYWPDLVELSSIIDTLHADIKNINNNLPPFWTPSTTGTPNIWFTETYPANNVGGVLTTLYQDVLTANAITSSGASIDYHYNIIAPDDSTIYVKLQQDTTLQVSIVGMKVGDAITGSSSGATGTIIAVSNNNISINLLSGTFTTSDSITGSLSGIIANVLAVYPLQVWTLVKLSPTLSSRSYFLDGKVFFTNIIAQTAKSEIIVLYNGQTTIYTDTTNISGINTSLPIKLLLQGENVTSNTVTAVYGRGILYQTPILQP